MDIKLKDILGCVRTCQILRIEDNDTGESTCPSYADILDYREHFVVGIEAFESDLTIKVQQKI